MISTILSIDDEEINHEIIREFLQNYNVESAVSAQEALEVLQTQDVDLILLDIVMPQTDGIELCEKVKQNKKTAHIPILFVTANTKDEYIRNAFERGGVDFIKKPVNAVDLQQRVKLHLKDRVIFSFDANHYFNLKTKTLYKNNKEIKLSNSEQKLLTFFIKNKGIIVDNITIANAIFENFNHEYKPKTIRNLISSLRAKLPEESIQSIYGSGYIFVN